MNNNINIAIIKYNAGNIRSVVFVFRRMGCDPVITNDHSVIRKADKVIFPGVGEAGTTMKYLMEHKLDKLIKELKQPVLGICLGMQLLCSFSEEADTECIGVFDETVKRFQVKDKVPHMGWNNIHDITGKVLPEEMNGQYFYFVHSYYAPVCRYTAAITDYINPFSSELEGDNLFATKFSLDKSGMTGEKLLKTFISI